jgi:hypothetical protein
LIEPPILLDTNVFIVEAGKLQAAINSEVLQELLYRYHRIDDAPKGIMLCRDALLLPLAVLPVTALQN